MNYQPNYKNIEKIENSFIKSFFNSFFFDNEISTIKKFWAINEKDILIDHTINKNHDINKITKVSIIITVYNQANCFYKALRSVQNQSLKDIEIIIVDDCSTDNSLEIIDNYQKADNRIIVLKHLYNYGKIKSRSDAIKIAKGEYILIIDGDDGLSNKDILYNSFNIAKIADLDIVEFKKAYFIRRRYKKIENNLDPIDNLNNRIIYQPELKYKFIKITENKKCFSYLNRNICSKLVKNKLFKKALEYIGRKYIDDYMIIFEDTIMSVATFILANSYYLMKQPGYYRSKGECSESITNNVRKRCGYNNCFINTELDSIKYLNFLLEKFNNTKFEGEFIFNEFVSIIYIFDLYNKINKGFKYVYKFIDLLLFKFSFYNKKQKDIIINFKQRMIRKYKKISNIRYYFL